MTVNGTAKVGSQETEKQPEVFRFSQKSIRRFSNITLLACLMLTFGVALFILWPPHGRDTDFLIRDAIAALLLVVVGIAWSLVFARRTIPKEFRRVELRFDGPNLVKTSGSSEERIPLETLSRVVRIADVDGRTAVIKLTGPGSKRRLIGFGEMDRIFNLISEALPEGNVVITKVGHRLSLRPEYWCLLIGLAPAIVWLALAGLIRVVGETVTMLAAGPVSIATLAVCAVYFRRRPDAESRKMSNLSLLFLIILAIAFAIFVAISLVIIQTWGIEELLEAFK